MAVLQLTLYYTYFLKGHTYRECCYNCHYAHTERAGDIYDSRLLGNRKISFGFFIA